MRIITNHKPRELQFFTDVPEAVRLADFDYVSKDDDTNSFFKFKSQWYDAGQFCPTPKNGELVSWDAVFSDSFFSGLLLKYKRDENGDIDPEFVIVGRYFT